MVKMQADLRVLPAEFLRILHSTLCHVAEKRLVSVVARTFRYLQDNRALRLCRSLDDSLQLLHVVEVEGRNCVPALDCLSEHLSSVHKTKFFEINHWFVYFSCL